jgi:uncharacterized integral membrane protein
MSDDRPTAEVTEPIVPPKTGVTPGAVIALLSLALFVVFIIQNWDMGAVTLLGFDVELPVWLLLMIVFALGFIVGYFARSRRLARKRRQAAARVG